MAKDEIYKKIPDETLELITGVVTEKAAEIFERKQAEYRRGEKDHRLKNTRLLLRKYRWLKTFEKRAVSDLTQILTKDEIYFYESLGVEMTDRRVESIADRMAFTTTVLGHVDTMLGVYKDTCMKSDKPELQRRWRVLEAMYLAEEPMSAADVADREHVNERTVYKDLNVVVGDLSGLFFGIDLSDLYM